MDIEEPGFYVVMVTGSKQAGLTGLKGSIFRKVAVDRSASSLHKSLATIRDNLESSQWPAVLTRSVQANEYSNERQERSWGESLQDSIYRLLPIDFNTKFMSERVKVYVDGEKTAEVLNCYDAR